MKFKKLPPPSPSAIENISAHHYKIYDKAGGKEMTSAHRMNLFYAVECRLKSLYYKDFKKQIRKGNQSDELLYAHDLDELIRSLGCRNMGTCPKIELKKDPGAKYPIKDAHAFWRYGYAMEESAEEALVKWLEGVYKKLKKGKY